MKVLFEDNHVIAVYKPHGVLVQDDASERVSLLVETKEYLREKYKKPGNVFLGLLHRLDRPVAGVVVFAKTSKAAARLSEQIRKRSAKKRYVALVQGTVPSVDEGELIDHLIEDDGFSRVGSSGDAGSREARLRYRVLDRAGNRALLEIELITGRKHQIRLQLASRGAPIEGDVRYGSRRRLPEDTIALVCVGMEFSHPTLGTPLRMELPRELWPTL